MNAINLLAFLANHLWQSTVFAAAVAVLVLVLKENHAQVRYGLWVTASIKFLIPLSLLASIGSQFQGMRRPSLVRSTAVVALGQWNEPFSQPRNVTSQIPVTTPSAWKSLKPWPVFLLALWLSGCVAVASSSYRRWRRVAALVRGATPLSEGREADVMMRLHLSHGLSKPIPIVASTSTIEPGLFGIVRPVLLLPTSIADQADELQLESILIHELSHARRRDNLWATLHMVTEAAFWFHPLVWWLGSRMVDERERACDEDVLSQGCEPGVYATAMVEICKWCLASPVKCVSGVTGSDLKTRVETIMKNGIVRKLNLGKKLLLAGAGIAAIAGPLFIGLLNAPQTRAQSAAIPKWDVISVKPCESLPRPIPGGRGNAGGGGPDPGRLNPPCMTLASFIKMAYIQFGKSDHYFWPQSVSISGGPPWIDSDLYQIEAKTEARPGQAMMRGPMLQALLEDRFKLKFRLETREVSAFALTVAKGGPRLPAPNQARDCVSFADLGRRIEAGQTPLPICGGMSRGSMTGPNRIQNLGDMSLDRFAQWMTEILGRPVFNKTAIPGQFDFHLEFAPDETTPGFRVVVIDGVRYDGEIPALPAGAPPEIIALRQQMEAQQVLHASDPARPPFLTAIQEQLGLKLEPTRGPGEFFVVDHVERPKPN